MALSEAAQVAEVAHDGQLGAGLDVEVHGGRQLGVDRLRHTGSELADTRLVEQRYGKHVVDLVPHRLVLELDVPHALDPVVERDAEPASVQLVQLVVRRVAPLQVPVVVQEGVPVAVVLRVHLVLDVALRSLGVSCGSRCEWMVVSVTWMAIVDIG